MKKKSRRRRRRTSSPSSKDHALLEQKTNLLFCVATMKPSLRLGSRRKRRRRRRRQRIQVRQLEACYALMVHRHHHPAQLFPLWQSCPQAKQGCRLEM